MLRTRLNVGAHQEKEKNEETGNKEAEEERKQMTNFKEGVCCPSAVVWGASWKKMVCVKGVPKVKVHKGVPKGT